MRRSVWRCSLFGHQAAARQWVTESVAAVDDDGDVAVVARLGQLL